tara:strand:- start:257 stop:790 length:534 start_codon:yes stop_codon:yes gene_type:complete
MLGKAIIPIIGMFVGDLVDGVVGAFKLIFSVFEAAYNFIDKYLIQPITSMINLIQRGISAIASLNPFGSSDSNQLQSGGSIDDGIVQGGKIISTHPEDTLIATKTPDSLLSNIAGGISGVVGGLMGGGSSDAQIVAKLDELITVMGANKDVYMDGRKVTAGVSSTVDKIGSNSYSLV